MNLHDQCERRLRSALRLVESAASQGFPNSPSEEALDKISRALRSRLELFQGLDSDISTIALKPIYRKSLDIIIHSLSYLGFLVRSADARNPFELYQALTELATQLVRTDSEEQAKLVLSSEWDYSPFTYNHPPTLDIDNFVFIGLPASETGNALITPLAGHEIGHNVWRTHKLESKLEPLIRKRVISFIADKFWQDFKQKYPELSDPRDVKDYPGLDLLEAPLAWSVRQLEELFCDFLGIRYFGETYLHAYTYLLMPSLSGMRSYYYPSSEERVKAHEVAAKKFGVSIPDGYTSLFDNSDNPPNAELELELVKHVVSISLDDLLDHVDEIVRHSGLDEYDSKKVESIRNRFSLGVPVDGPEALVNIISAGWKFYLDKFAPWRSTYPDIWSDHERRENVLSDLMFKSMEVSYVVRNHQ